MFALAQVTKSKRAFASVGQQRTLYQPSIEGNETFKARCMSMATSNQCSKQRQGALGTHALANVVLILLGNA
jgi:hypothetical protein